MTCVVGGACCQGDMLLSNCTDTCNNFMYFEEVELARKGGRWRGREVEREGDREGGAEGGRWCVMTSGREGGGGHVSPDGAS